MAQYIEYDQTAADYIWTADHADFDVTDLEIRVKVALDDYTVGADEWLLEKWIQGTNSFFGQLEVSGTPGLMKVVWKDSTTQSLLSTIAVPVTDGDIAWLRWTLDVDNGSSDAAANFYYSTETLDDHTAVTWTQLGDADILHGGTTTIDTGTSRLSMGRYNEDGSGSVHGKVYQAILLDGIGGTPVAHLNLNDFALGEGNGATFTDAYSKQWTLQSGSGNTVSADPLGAPLCPIIRRRR